MTSRARHSSLADVPTIQYLRPIHHGRSALLRPAVLPPEKLAELPQHDLPGRFLFEQEMIAARERYEPRSRDAGREQTPLVEGHDRIALTMQHDTGGLDVGEHLSHVETREVLHEARG